MAGAVVFRRIEPCLSFDGKGWLQLYSVEREKSSRALPLPYISRTILIVSIYGDCDSASYRRSLARVTPAEDLLHEKYDGPHESQDRWPAILRRSGVL